MEARRREAVESYGSGAMSLAGFQAIDRDVAGRIDAIPWSRMGAQVRRIGEVLPANTKALGSWWTRRNEDRRLLVGTVLEAVEIGPGVLGRNTFDPERVTLVWRA